MPFSPTQQRQSISRRQLTLTLSAVFVFSFLFNAALLARDYRMTLAEIKGKAGQMLDAMQPSATQAAYTLDERLALEVVTGLFQFEAVHQIHLKSDTGHLLARLQREIPLAQGFEGWLFGSLHFKRDLHYEDTQTGQSALSVGVLELVLDASLASGGFTERALSELLWILVQTLALAILLLGISARLITKPIEAVVAALEHRKAHPEKALIPIPIPNGCENNEIGVLVMAFNQQIHELALYTREREAMIASLSQANTELSRLGEVMAHHFQEPARRLVSFARQLQSRSALVDDEDGRLALHFIATQSARLSELVRDAQRYLALDHRMIQGRHTDTKKALLQVMQAAPPPCRNALVLKTALPCVAVDERTVFEVFSLLADNSFKYAHSERPIRIEVSAHTEGERVFFRFADNGTGIAPEYRAHVFKLFSRLVPNSIPGTGMGLALFRKMIVMKGGQVRIDDGLEGGAAFIFDWPMGDIPDPHKKEPFDAPA
jgi:signal transduction histidine kinase